MFSYYERMLSVVPRWSIAPRLNKQTVAEHSFYVTLYASKLAILTKLPVEKRLIILEQALRHDMVEAQTGDTPGPIKRIIVDRTKLKAFERQFFDGLGEDYVIEGADDQIVSDIIKAADLVDELFWVSMEVLMGNRLLEPMRAKVMTRLNLALNRLGMPELFMQLVEECANMGRGVDFPTNNEDLK